VHAQLDRRIGDRPMASTEAGIAMECMSAERTRIASGAAMSLPVT